jgi:hypothetical protein
MKFKGITLLTILFCCGLFLNAGEYTFSGYLPKVEKTGSQLVIKINTQKMEKDFFIYYRTEGLKNYQVRKMKTDKEGHVYYQLSTDNLYGKTLEYFIVENTQSASRSISPVFTISEVTKKESPEIYFLDAGQESGGGTPKIGFPVKIGASLSTTSRIRDKTDFPREKFDATGNLRLYRNISEEKYEFDFDTNVTYTHHPSETESKFNLSNMKVRFKAGNHTFELGDLNIANESRFAGYLMRRGLFYEMKSKTISFGSFFTNAQEKTGFEGLGIPATNANVFGATAGVNIGTIFKVGGMFMAGKDNLDSKTVVSTEDVYREGNFFALWSQLSLLKNQLTLNGEFANSNYGSGADSDSVEKESDTAWRGEANFIRGIVNAHVDYSKVGGKFGSIANLFILEGREGLNSNVILTVKSISFTLNYQDMKTNIDSEVLPMQNNKTMGAGINWQITGHINAEAKYSLINLDYDESSGFPTGTEDMDTVEYSGSLGYVAGGNGITISLSKLEAKTFHSNLNGSVSLNLQFGNVLRLNPSCSYLSTEDLTTNSKTKTYSTNLNGELTFIPEYFSLSFLGSWIKNDSDISEGTNLTADGSLNFNMSKLFNYKFNPSLSLISRYEENKIGDTSTSNLTLYLQLNISF